MEVMGWATFILLAIFAFILMPVHERFVDAQGRQTDVSPDAPPVPEALKPISERTGKKEKFVDAQGRYTDVSPNAPPMPAWLNPGGQNRSTIVSPESVRPMDTSTDYSRTAPVPSNLNVISSPTAAAPRITSTLGTADPSISGMYSDYTSGVIAPTGSPWAGLQNMGEMAAVPTNPAFLAQTRPAPPALILNPTTPDTGLFGPGPNVLRKNLVSCRCASQAGSCPVHR